MWRAIRAYHNTVVIDLVGDTRPDEITFKCLTLTVLRTQVAVSVAG